MIKNLQDLKREATKRGSFFFTATNYWKGIYHEVLPTGDFTGYLVDSIQEEDMHRGELYARQYFIRSYRVIDGRLDIWREAEFTNLADALDKAREWQKRGKK